MHRTRAQVDDSPSGLPEARKYRSATVEYADQVDHDVLSPSIWFAGLQCTYRPDDAGVVDEDVNLAVVLERRLSQLLGVGLPGDIAGYSLRSSFPTPDGCGDRFACLVHSGSQEGRCPAAGQLKGDGLADPPARPGDYRNFSGKHAPSSRFESAGAYSSGVRVPPPAPMPTELSLLCFPPLAGGSR